MKLDVRCKNPKMHFLKANKPAGRHEDSKNVSSKKIQIKTNFDNTKDNILKYKAGIIWKVMQFQIWFYSFHYLKANFLLQLFQI